MCRGPSSARRPGSSPAHSWSPVLRVCSSHKRRPPSRWGPCFVRRLTLTHQLLHIHKRDKVRPAEGDHLTINRHPARKDRLAFKAQIRDTKERVAGSPRLLTLRTAGPPCLTHGLAGPVYDVESIDSGYGV
ncbi:hypothetical protein RR46_04605 [Papilio xuthus]|uniref:Uncharacterized protein n=1 Tax=Papilio xuthus TaxID=66420 RepID=A0A194PZ73_PAPXU|nr:hypothetical protein RR46_04605 [Papilio xuthus]